MNDRVKSKPGESSASAGGVGHFFGEVANTTSLAVGRASAFMVAAFSSTAHNSSVGIDHLTHAQEEIRDKCERSAEAEKADDASVKRTGEKAKKAAERAANQAP